MLMEKEIQDKLVAFICESFMVEPDEFNLEESLVDQGVIDSIGLVEISAFIEETFGIKVAETDMTRQNFGSVKKMVAFIVSKNG
ncbi:MAG TPA: acyl carrier protein [Smithellaceae bacterium]|nr:acyl carrier protein [Smithellaceae bacterium]